MTPAKKLLFIISILLIIALSAIGFLAHRNEKAPKDLKIIFFDVGQGDAALVITPEQKKILIDGGPDNAVIYKLGKHLPFWQRQIDLLILSHPHADHIVGLIEVLKRYQVKKVLLTGVLYTTYEYEKFLNLIKDQDIKIEIAKESKLLEFDSEVELKTFYPTTDLSGVLVDNLNNSSIVLQVIYGQSKILFTGDLESKAQLEIINEDLASQILKVPHHGSSDNLNSNFFEVVNPEIAIISVGENKFGHPSPRLTNLLKRAGVEVLTTKEIGDIVIICDQWRCQKKF